MTSMGGTNLPGWMEKNHFDKEGANFILEAAQNNVKKVKVDFVFGLDI